MTNRDKNLRILDAVYHEVALIDADEGQMSRDERRDADAIMAFTQARLAELRRAEFRRDAARAQVAAAKVRPSILAMTRAAIVARLEMLGATAPGAIFAHRGFDEVAEDDLRTALEDAEALAEREP